MSDSFRIEFSGTFDSCYRCAGKPTETLLRKSFSGVIEIQDDPNVAPILLDSSSFPWNTERVLYQFNNKSFFSISTQRKMFNLYEEAPVDVVVNYCNDPGCPASGDFLKAIFSGGSYWYALTLGLPPTPFESSEIPSNGKLSQMTGSFEVFTENFSESVAAGLEGQPIVFTVSNRLLGPDNDPNLDNPPLVSPFLFLLLED